MANVTGNVMTLNHLHDFYYLEAMQAGISRTKATNPSFAFRRSVEKLENDVNREFESITHSIAKRIYVYLWAALLGEARHADRFCDMHIEDFDGYCRETVYDKATNFFPDDDNVIAIEQIYSQEWNSSSFGGKKWMEIVNGFKMYGKVSNATFIDHAVDLEHNGGTVFSKYAKSQTKLDTGLAERIRRFLDYKFAKDILNEKLSGYEINVTRNTYMLLTRFNNVIESINAIEYCNPSNGDIKEYEIDWDYETLTLTESTRIECENCNAQIDEEEVYNSPDGESLCNSCYSRQYATCDKCHDTVNRDEAIETTSHKFYSYVCEDCAMGLGYALCEDCGSWKDDYQNVEGSIYCESCVESHAEYCEECNEWTFDFCDKHEVEEVEEVESTTYPLWTDGDGILQDVQVSEWVEYAGMVQIIGEPSKKMKVYQHVCGLRIVATKNGYSIIVTDGARLKGDIAYLHNAKSYVESIASLTDWNNISKTTWSSIGLSTKSQIYEILQK